QAGARGLTRLPQRGWGIVDHDFDAAVLLPPGRGFVARNRFTFALARCYEPHRADPLPHQVGLHCLGAPLRQPLVVVFATDAVGVAFDRDSAIRIGVEEVDQLVEIVPRTGLQVCLAAREQDISERQYQPAVRHSRLQLVDLPLQLRGLQLRARRGYACGVGVAARLIGSQLLFGAVRPRRVGYLLLLGTVRPSI